MNEKLSLQDLVDLLSKKAKITKKEADSFYREFFQLILERIFDNDIVKIKDFGTFKLISVSSRESVNVNTGERIEIPSHFRLNFIPDRVLKQMVNKPFSQFETILLEDGVVFDASISAEEDANEDEVIENFDLEEDAADEDVISQNEETVHSMPYVESQNVEPEKEEVSQPDITDSKPKEPEQSENKPEQPVNRPYTRSFVYAYTTSEPEEKTGSITLTVPKDNSTGAVRPSKIEQDIPVQDISTQNIPAQDPPRQDIPEKKGFAVELRPLPQTPPVNINIDHDLDSEIETEEDVIIPTPVVSRMVRDEKQPELAADKKPTVAERKSAFSSQDPERPLFPAEDNKLIIEEENDTFEPVNLHSSYAGNNKPTEKRSVSFSETIDDVNIPYQDYSGISTKSKFKKWLPVVLFFLVIIGFLAYGLVKMLRKPYDFEYNLGRTNLSLTDTLPFIEEATPQAKKTNTLLDSIKKVQHDSVTDTIKTVKKEPVVQPVSEAAVSPKAGIVGNADSATTKLIDSQKNGFVISDKLQFPILNKAEYHLSKYGNNTKSNVPETSPVQNKEAKPTVATAPKAQYATINKGVTLRTMSTTYYGNPSYWVYIYQSNKRSIANPNNVPVGTTLLIPSLSEYGISNAKDPKTIQTAKALEAKILGQK